VLVPTKDAEVSGETIAFPAEPQRPMQQHLGRALRNREGRCGATLPIVLTFVSVQLPGGE
jgi:hypothetical protein